jgi:deoxyribodipyrimidine photo-lyase
MHKKYKLSIFIFRRDLRIHDNTGLRRALEQSEFVLPCFIADPAQITEQNTYRSLPGLQFMLESLHDLQEQLIKAHGKLYFFIGEPIEILTDLISRYNIDAVFFNIDYTPFSRDRDTRTEQFCSAHSITCESYEDALLIDPKEVLTAKQTPYLIFTPFFRAASQLPVNKPYTLVLDNFFIDTSKQATYNLEDINQHIFNQPLTIKAGRTAALSILAGIHNFENYDNIRDFPEYNTTQLSAHNKFGTVSIREVYWSIHNALGQHHSLIRSLYWRDFFTYITYYFPRVLGHAFREEFDRLTWDNNQDFFYAWSQGETGFPLVDAGMRELNQTGFMHNRVRMVAASLLIKDLHIDWRWGEHYFAQKLIDYDPAVNNGNWQWVASTGTDAQPYFRIFNPWLQQKKYDPDCVYIKKWIPELRALSPKQIHKWYKEHTNLAVSYPTPIVDHTQEIKKTRVYYKKASKTKNTI